MAKRYIRLNWQNAPNTATPLNAENLNIMDKGIDDIDTALENHINSMIHSDAVNDTTKYPSSAVTFSHGTQISSLQNSVSEINNNLTQQIDISSSFSALTGVTASGMSFIKRGKRVYYTFTLTVTMDRPMTEGLATLSGQVPIIRQFVSMRYNTVSASASSNHGVKQYQVIGGQVINSGGNALFSSGMTLYSGDVLLFYGAFDVQ